MTPQLTGRELRFLDPPLRLLGEHSGHINPGLALTRASRKGGDVRTTEPFDSRFLTSKPSQKI